MESDFIWPCLTCLCAVGTLTLWSPAREQQPPHVPLTSVDVFFHKHSSERCSPHQHPGPSFQMNVVPAHGLQSRVPFACCLLWGQRSQNQIIVIPPRVVGLGLHFPRVLSEWLVAAGSQQLTGASCSLCGPRPPRPLAWMFIVLTCKESSAYSFEPLGLPREREPEDKRHKCGPSSPLLARQPTLTSHFHCTHPVELCPLFPCILLLKQ